MKLQKYLIDVVICLCLFFAGCSSSTNVATDTNISDNSYFAANLANLEKGNHFKIKYMRNLCKYGRTWVMFENNLGNTSYAMVNASGKILKEYPEYDGAVPTVMDHGRSNGWSYGFDGDYFYMFDPDGNITQQNKYSDVQCWNVDFTAIATGNKTKFYSLDGTFLMETDNFIDNNASYSDWRYPGHEIAILINNNNNDNNNYNKIKVCCTFEKKTFIYELDEINCIKGLYFNAEQDMEKDYVILGLKDNQIILMDDQGNIFSGYKILETDPYFDDPSSVLFGEMLWNGILIDKSEKYARGPVLFNVVTGERQTMDSSLAKKWNNDTDDINFCTSGSISNGLWFACFTSDENENIKNVYYLDENMEIIAGPFTYCNNEKELEITNYNSDRFAVMGKDGFTVYDGKGNAVFHSEEKGLEEICEDYRDGYTLAKDNQGNYVMIDIEGDIVIDNIHY